jgi:pimeloyl-ACP methyl ester carboxylesterase
LRRSTVAMPELSFDRYTLRYEDRGAGVPVVLTPGGRWGGYVMAVVAAELAKSFRVITWDRSNTDGGSSVVIDGAGSEADLWADQLAALIQRLSLGLCYIGEYAGCRTTPLACLKYPHLVKGLMLAWPSGGEIPAERLPKNMYRPYMRAALRGGMESVIQTPLFAAAITKNPSNRQRLSGMDPRQFVRQMAYWEAFFTTSADLPTAGCPASEKEWGSISVPSIVTGGCDPIHPTAAAERIHGLLRGSDYHDPVVTLDEWNALFNIVPYPEVSNLQGSRIAPVWRLFIEKSETLSAPVSMDGRNFAAPSS